MEFDYLPPRLSFRPPMCWRLLAVALLLVAGCNGNRGDAWQVIRVADDRHGDTLVDGVGTRFFPKAEVSGETRPTCDDSSTVDSLTGKQSKYEIDLPANSAIEIAYALQVRGGFEEPVEFLGTVVDTEGRRASMQQVLDGTSDHEFARWHEAVIDTAGLSGRAILTLSTVSSSSGIDVASGSLLARPFFACPIVFTRDVPRIHPNVPNLPNLPNVVIISLDTLRADRLGIYGYDRPTSPRIDAYFRAHGVVVEHAYSQATNTLRGHAAMMTGMLPAGAIWDDGFTLKGFPSIADHLRRAGYRTAAFTEDAYMTQMAGFDAGFDVFYESKSESHEIPGTGEISNTFARALEWVEHHPDGPIFLFLHTYEVHSPYEPPQSERDRFASASATSPVKQDSDLYDAEIAYTDEQVGRLIDTLNSAGILENAILVITSDHGEEFGEHGGRYHGPHLHDEILRVPMLVSAPGMIPSGTRSFGPVGVVDLPPTILELVGLPIPDYLEGVSMGQILRGERPARARDIVSEAYTPRAHTIDGIDTDWIPPSLSITRFPLRVIRIRTPLGVRYEAYDLRQDALERIDRYADLSANATEINEMTKRLNGYEAESRRLALSNAARAGLSLETKPDALVVDDAVMEKLKRLGYIE